MLLIDWQIVEQAERLDAREQRRLELVEERLVALAQRLGAGITTRIFLTGRTDSGIRS